MMSDEEALNRIATVLNESVLDIWKVRNIEILVRETGRGVIVRG